MKRALCILLAIAAAGLWAARPAYSYLPGYTRGSSGAAVTRWDFSAFAVTWRLNPDITEADVTGSRSVRDALLASFNTWKAAPNAVVPVTAAGDSTSRTSGFDGANLVCFVCTADFSRESETLAISLITAADGPGLDTRRGGRTTFAGQLVDVDILFNPSVPYSTDGGGGREDVQTVATHEIGHFLGLDHTGVVRAAMFPFAPAQQRTLSYDDVAGLAFLYPKPAPDFPTATISGTVRRSGGAGVFGAHVFADSITDTQAYPGFNIRKSPVSILSLPDGRYTITGLPPDSYTVTAEPLDEPMTNADIAEYGPAFGRGPVSTDFDTRWH